MAAHSFLCSSCGAPIIPRGSTPLINCPYCHASVEVPEKLRQVSGAAGWFTYAFDAFASNENHWLEGSLSDEYFTKLNRTIAEGRYRWEAQTGRPSSIATAWLNYPVSDFHLIVNCKHVRGSKAGSAFGVVFRIQDNFNYYWFRITDNQFFSVSVVEDSQWTNLVDWTRTDTIKPYGVNEVEVLARETHFTFLINGQIVSELDDDRFSKGVVGLAVEGYTGGEEITFDFMDITLRAP